MLTNQIGVGPLMSGRVCARSAAAMLALCAGLALPAFAQSDVTKQDAPSKPAQDPALVAAVRATFTQTGDQDNAGINKSADDVERARATWPFTVTREEVDAMSRDNSGEVVMLQRLAARNIPLQPAHTPNYYVYQGQTIAMDLDVTRVAILMSEAVPNGQVRDTALASARGAGENAPAVLTTGRWAIITLERPFAGYEDANTRIDALANMPGVVMASPVFHHIDQADGFMIPTPEIIVRVKEEMRANAAGIVAQKAPGLQVINPVMGNIAGMMQLRTSIKNGFAAMAEANRLAQDGAFEWAEVDLRQTAQADYTPNDPDYPTQWHHSNDGSNGGVVDADMDTSLAWDYTRGRSLIDVLIMDNGTQSNHPDLNWQNGRDFTTGAVGGVGTGAPTSACDNHGTPVAGIVAQRINNNLLGAGTAPGANVLGAKVGDATIQNPPCSNSWTLQGSYIVNAIAWGVSQGAEVSNSSFSTGSSNAVTTAYQDAAQNNDLLNMASTGNDSDPTGANYPANIGFVYGVGNLTRAGVRNSSSNYGPGLDWSAPGTSIITLDRTGSAGYSTGDNTSFGGTSAASPNAAGAAALFRSAYPWATRSQTIAGIIDGCRELGATGYDSVYGYGFVNPYYSILDVNPSNDSCVGATSIPSGTLSYSQVGLDTTWATDDWRDPQASCEVSANGEGASVYWRWTAPNTGTLDINTNGSTIDTVLSIWDGCGGINLGGIYIPPNQIACDDDSGTGTQSQILNVPVTIGETYIIKVSRYGDLNPGGDVNLSFTLTPTPPANDSCASPTVVPGNAYGTFNPAIIDTDVATSPSCENEEDCEAGGVGTSNAVWYQFTPFEDGVITVDTEGSDYDTVVSIFPTACALIINGNCLRSTPLACDDDGGTGTLSLISGFEVSQGTTYYIKVADWGAEGGGALDFNVQFSPPPAPANNSCFNATPIPASAPGGNFSDSIRAHSATDVTCDPNPSCDNIVFGSSGSVWYSLTPACNGRFGITTAGSSYDTVISIWSNCRSTTIPIGNCTFSTQLACDNDSGPGNTSTINNFQVNGGEDYLILITANGLASPDRLEVSTQFICDPTPAGCDDIDFNNDGLFPDTQDIDDFISVFGGGTCASPNPPACNNDLDFNNDGLFPDTLDIDALISVFSGGPCL
jgi:subtilisin family serine protease